MKSANEAIVFWRKLYLRKGKEGEIMYINIPKEIREILGLKPGQLCSIRLDGKKIIITPWEEE